MLSSVRVSGKAKKRLLGRGILLLDVSVDEDSDLLGDTVDLVLLLGDVELGQELVEHLDRLLVLRLRHVVDYSENQVMR